MISMKIQLSLYPIGEKEFFSNVKKLDSFLTLYTVRNSRLVFNMYFLFNSPYLCFVIYLKNLCNILYKMKSI